MKKESYLLSSLFVEEVISAIHHPGLWEDFLPT